MKTHIGRFELKRLLGQGAQAQVWLAFDPRLEREVAIKQMKPAMAAGGAQCQPPDARQHRACV